jgi:putative photosynthetic complex assembly protein 2
VGFLAALALWGWIELAFLTGVITGPNTAAARGVPEWERFMRAWGTVAYHEMLLVGADDRALVASWGRQPVRHVDLRGALSSPASRPS